MDVDLGLHNKPMAKPIAEHHVVSTLRFVMVARQASMVSECDGDVGSPCQAQSGDHLVEQASHDAGRGSNVAWKGSS
jgi:hypothetical protein